MGPASFPALGISQLESGVRRMAILLLALSRVISTPSILSPSHPMARELSLAQATELSGFGMLVLTNLFSINAKVTLTESPRLHFPVMALISHPHPSIALSPDGTRLVSGSADNMVRVWDVKKGTLLAGPFKDHSKAVQSVAFSPNGAYIASGSLDRTVLVRSSSDGTLIAPPFTGHTDTVQSVAFSPDSTQLISGSSDGTIRLWDIRNGTLATDPFLGHTGGVISVAFSPCGQYVVSGSDDRTIRVWNVQSGFLINDPFTGHTNIVWSVAFSPNGQCIVSGSDDRTVRVWHTHSGVLVAGPFFGHVDTVMSVAFFPDGTRIVSGSWDSTIRIWDLSDIPGIPSTSKYPPALPSSDLAHSGMPPTDWTVKDDGWIMNYDGNVLFWAPPEVIQRLLTPHCSSIISRFGTIEVDMSAALFGENWKGCYVSV
ncbi:hypothetical protein CTheo_8362 [Ceratobasidium theobromae]|uniref:Uncharacterized protein n=1 Tax=Ceratobasidium theobromae TaxID=1582974 RepID=A0A5N5Q8Z5_9AGAM|nr:hypothetical protein CTheo_8362 [Ceratobasidium theobromae]